MSINTSFVIKVKYLEIELMINCSKGQRLPKYIKMKFPLYFWNY